MPATFHGPLPSLFPLSLPPWRSRRARLHFDIWEMRNSFQKRLKFQRRVKRQGLLSISWQHSCTACTSLAALHVLVSTGSCPLSNSNNANEPTDRLTKLFEHICARIRQVLGLSDIARIGRSICYLPVLPQALVQPFCEMKRVRFRRHTRQSHAQMLPALPRPTFSPRSHLGDEGTKAREHHPTDRLRRCKRERRGHV